MLSSISKISAVSALIAAAFAAPASAEVTASAKLAFQGSVIENTCTFASANLDIKLPKISKAALTASDNVVGTQAFVVKLNDCAEGTRLALNFGFDQALDAKTGRITVKDGSDNSLQLQLMNQQHQAINLSDGTNNPLVTVGQDGSAELVYHVGYVGNPNIKAGDYTATLPVTLAYE